MFWGMLLVCASHAARAEALPPPEEPGPYPVGVTTMRFEDCSRTDPATGKHRILMTEIWYPATEDSRALPKNRLLDFFQRSERPELYALLKLAFDADLAAADKTFSNFAVRDARVGEGHFPLLLFSHGNGGLRMQNAFWCEHMASHGYIVMAPDHAGNCAITFIDGEIVFFNDSGEGREQSKADRPKDLSFLIDAMERLNQGGDSRFRGKVDLERIGVAGHSFGGFTSVWTADHDPRVDAIIPMAGVAPERTRFDVPALVFIATEDDTLGLERTQHIRTFYEESTGPKYSVEFKNGGHYSFTEMYQLQPAFGDGVGDGRRLTNGETLHYVSMEKAFRLTNGYSTAFFGKLLKGMDGYTAYLETNQDTDELIVK